jgi:hypothetical protein
MNCSKRKSKMPTGKDLNFRNSGAFLKDYKDENFLILMGFPFRFLAV